MIIYKKKWSNIILLFLQYSIFYKLMSLFFISSSIFFLMNTCLYLHDSSKIDHSFLNILHNDMWQGFIEIPFGDSYNCQDWLEIVVLPVGSSWLAIIDHSITINISTYAH